MLFEIKGTRPELAVKALKVRVPFLLLRPSRLLDRLFLGNLDERIVPSRVLPYIIKLSILECHKAKDDLNEKSHASDLNSKSISNRLKNIMI